MTRWISHSASAHAKTWVLLAAPLRPTEGGWGRAELAYVEEVPINQQKFYAKVFGAPDTGARERFNTLEEAMKYCEMLAALENAS